MLEVVRKDDILFHNVVITFSTHARLGHWSDGTHLTNSVRPPRVLCKPRSLSHDLFKLSGYGELTFYPLLIWHINIVYFELLLDFWLKFHHKSQKEEAHVKNWESERLWHASRSSGMYGRMEWNKTMQIWKAHKFSNLGRANFAITYM